jgi:hypothetical protein
MAIAVKLDFDNPYNIEPVSEDMRTSIFQTELRDGTQVSLKVEISSEPHELLPNVFNLAFGPMNDKGKIDDKAELSHKDYSKVFSSILITGMLYLEHNRSHYLGIDGSNNARAYLYYRFLKKNYDYLNKFFKIYGLKYYVRISRFGKSQYDNPFNFKDILPGIVRIKKNMPINPEFMYNYFIFKLK